MSCAPAAAHRFEQTPVDRSAQASWAVSKARAVITYTLTEHLGYQLRAPAASRKLVTPRLRPEGSFPSNVNLVETFVFI